MLVDTYILRMAIGGAEIHHRERRIHVVPRQTIVERF
jgi:hypothetical protein